MGLFSSGKSKIKVPGFVLESGKYVTDLLKGGTPSIPAQEIAGFSENELSALQMISEWLEGGNALGPEFETALGEAQRTVTGVNVMEEPAMAALMEEIRKAGTLETNRLGRMLSMGGALSSSTGANMLGRSAVDMERAMLAGLAPYIEAERGRQVGSIGTLAGLSQTKAGEPLMRADVAMQTGALERALEQAKLDAAYKQRYETTMFPYSTLAPIATSAIGGGGQYSYVSGGESSLFSQLSSLAGPILRAYGLGGFGGATAGGTKNLAQYATGYHVA